MYPGKHRVGREIDVNGAKHHRRAVMGFEPPFLTAKDIIIGDRVQNFRWRQLEGSASSGKLRPKSITVTTGSPSGFSTLPRPCQTCRPIRPTAMKIQLPAVSE